MDRASPMQFPTDTPSKVDWQTPVGSLPNETWDVAVVGAGPAGSIAALDLALLGHKTLLIDSRRFPREKVCGDGLLGDALRCLERHGLYEQVAAEAHPLPEAMIYSPSRHSFPIASRFLILRRDRFDTMMARAAVDRGAVFAHGNASDIQTGGDGFAELRFGSEAEPIRARIVVIATGANVALAQKLGLVSNTRPYAFALRCYVRSKRTVEHLILSYDRELLPGYAWIMPLGEGLFNVGCGTLYTDKRRPSANVNQMFRKFIDSFPVALELFRHGEQITPLRGAPLRCNLKGTLPFKPPNILLAGETIGTTFPFSGEGIGKAMESGELAAATIHDSLAAGDLTHLHRYPERLESEFRSQYRGYIAAQRWFSKAWLHDFVCSRISRSRYLQQRFKNFVSESGDPRTVYAISSLLMSFIR